MKKLPIVATLITFGAIVILLKLGFWQLERGKEKQQIEASVATQGERVFNSLATALNGSGDSDFKKVKLSGRVLTDSIIFWDNRIVNGKVGYEVLAPLESDEGLILVNFGWVQDISFRQKLPEVEVPDLLDSSVATIYQLTLNRLINNDSVVDSWPLLVGQPDTTFLSHKLGKTLLPQIAFINNSEKYELQNNFKPVTMSPEKHFGYSVQWFGLAIACLVVYVFALKKKWRNDRKSNK